VRGWLGLAREDGGEGDFHGRGGVRLQRLGVMRPMAFPMILQFFIGEAAERPGRLGGHTGVIGKFMSNLYTRM
jgi:hypothetical protein